MCELTFSLDAGAGVGRGETAAKRETRRLRTLLPGHFYESPDQTLTGQFTPK